MVLRDGSLNHVSRAKKRRKKDAPGEQDCGNLEEHGCCQWQQKAQNPCAEILATRASVSLDQKKVRVGEGA